MQTITLVIIVFIMWLILTFFLIGFVFDRYLILLKRFDRNKVLNHSEVSSIHALIENSMMRKNDQIEDIHKIMGGIVAFQNDLKGRIDELEGIKQANIKKDE